jgi:hypothetical protein
VVRGSLTADADVLAAAAAGGDRQAEHVQQGRVAFVETGRDHGDLEVLQRAQRATGDHLEQAGEDGMLGVVESLEHYDVGVLGRALDALCLSSVAGEGFFGQHVLAGADGRDVLRRVHAVGQRVVDSLDLWVVDHLSVAV